MHTSINNKILPINDLIAKVTALQQEGKVVAQSHGIFDLIHPGHINHLNMAKKKADVLIVTVIKDKNVRRGPGRPIFTDQLRLENIASMEQVDYVSLVDDEVPYECVKRINPQIFAKGQSHAGRDKTIHENIFEKNKESYFGKSTIYETKGPSFSSSNLINDFLDIYPEKTKTFIEEFKNKYTFQNILEKITALKDLKVLLIGDGIIDEYNYCTSMGKSPKSQLIVNKYVNHEIFAGGVFAIANHIASICDNVHLVTLLGRENSEEDFIRSSLKTNVNTKLFYRDNGPTIIKKRFINQYHNQKIFEINYLSDDNIEDKCLSEVIKYIKSVIADYDLVLVSDFGHGLITNNIIKIIAKLSNKLAVNAQTNGANAGYNLITKYKKADFICLDLPEARLATQEKYADAETICKKLLKDINTDHLLITIGGEGSLCINREKETNRTPAFATRPVDIIGAGDAFFAYTAPCFATDMPMDLASFIGNAVGALAVQIVGNKKSVEKHELLEFIHAVLR